MTREIKTKITADPSSFQKGVDSAQEKLKVFGKEVRSSANDFAKWGAAGVAAAGAAGAAIVAMSFKATDAQAKLARNLGGTIEGLDAATRAGDLTGVSFGELTGASEKLNRALGTALTNNSSAASKALQRLDLDAGELSGMDIDERFIAIAERMEEMGLSSQEVAANMRDLGVEQASVVGLMREGLPALKSSRDFMEKYGTAISQIDATNVEAANDAMADARRIGESFINQLSAKFAPIVEEISNSLLGVAENAGGAGNAAETAFNKAIDAGAFVADAVDGVGRTFEILGKTAAVVGLGIGESMLSVADFIVNRPVEAVNELIDVLNTLPGVDITPVSLTGFGETIQQELGILRGAIDIGLSDIDDVLNRPLAGAEFKKFVDEVQAGAMDRYVTNAENAAAKAAEAIRKGKETEAGHIAEWDEIIDQMVLDAREKKFTDAAAEEQFLNDLIAQGEQKRYEILAESHAKQQALDEANYAARKAALGDVLDNLATLMGSKSRKMFEIGKVAAIANTVVSTMQGAQQAYTALSGIPIVGPALGVAAAGAAIAAGAVRVQAINAQSFSKGSVSGAAAGQTAQNIGNQVAGGSGGPSQTQYVQGLNPNDLFSGEQVINLINNAQENGARLVIL